jgi:hypothetical protein
MTWEGQGWTSAVRDYHANREAAQRQAMPFRFVLPRDITLQPKAFLIDGFVGAAETSAWYGPPDGGKSTVVLDAACHVAAGLDYCGRRVTHPGQNQERYLRAVAHLCLSPRHQHLRRAASAATGI